MEPNRWFKVLVLGGAMLAQSCGSPQNTRVNHRGTGGSGGGAGPDGGASGGAGGTGAAGGREAGSPDDTAGTGGQSPSGSGGSGGSSSSAGGAAPTSSGGAGGGAGGGGGSAGGAAGAGGSAGPLQCRIDAQGHGDARDPCGCPCCWANDCLNTNAACCVGFCKSGDNGRGCCTE